MVDPIRVQATNGQWFEIPASEVVGTISKDDGSKAADPKSIVFRFQAHSEGIQINRLWLTETGVEALNRQLVVPENLVSQAGLYGAQFLSDMNYLREDHPIIFYGALVVLGGALAVILIPALSGITLTGALTLGLAVKGSFIGIGLLGTGYSLYNYHWLNQLNPATPMGRYHVEREKISEVGTAIIAALGIVIISAETLAMIRAAKEAQAVGGVLEAANEVSNAGQGGSLLLGAAANFHLDEVAILFAGTEKGANMLAEQRPYLCQMDPELKQWVCIEEDEIQVNELYLKGMESHSIPLDPRLTIN